MCFLLQQLASRGPPPEDVDLPQTSHLRHPKHYSEPTVNHLTVIKLDVKDPDVTPHGQYAVTVNGQCMDAGAFLDFKICFFF